MSEHGRGEGLSREAALTVPIKRVRGERDVDLPLPSYMSAGAAGMDLVAALEGEVILGPGEIKLIPTGVAVALPPGFEGQIRARSGLACKHGVTVVNGPGTVDSDYRGEVMVGLINLGKEPVVIRRGERIAQLVVNRVYRVSWVEEQELNPTGRDAGGFGHTGR